MKLLCFCTSFLFGNTNDVVLCVSAAPLSTVHTLFRGVPSMADKLSNGNLKLLSYSKLAFFPLIISCNLTFCFNVPWFFFFNIKCLDTCPENKRNTNIRVLRKIYAAVILEQLKYGITKFELVSSPVASISTPSSQTCPTVFLGDNSYRFFARIGPSQ